MAKLIKANCTVFIDGKELPGFKPLYEMYGFKTNEDYENFLVLKVREKEQYIYTELRERVGGMRLSLDESHDSITPSHLTHLLVAITHEWTVSQREKYQQTKHARLFDEGGLLSDSPEIDYILKMGFDDNTDEND
ncbi:hypothetical protein ACQEXU_10895 [Vibrio sp. TRT 21S02]|uniref:hypothetical protein n=1 Tax=Vibrio sp. TRT 21S02 TaxID=3418507 RepID=UPI003CF713C0